MQLMVCGKGFHLSLKDTAMLISTSPSYKLHAHINLDIWLNKAILLPAGKPKMKSLWNGYFSPQIIKRFNAKVGTELHIQRFYKLPKIRDPCTDNTNEIHERNSKSSFTPRQYFLLMLASITISQIIDVKIINTRPFLLKVLHISVTMSCVHLLTATGKK